MIQYKDLTAGPNFFLMAGPCAIEDEDTPLFIAERIVEMTTRLGIPYIFKGSYRKANRSRVDSFTGIGDEKALRILRRVRETFDIPVVTDIHETHQARPAAEVVDILQIPAFLSRQTDLLHAAAQTNAIVNVKKGQFLAPKDMRNVVDKLLEGGNSNILLTERGASFGYNNLVVDMRSFPIMRSFGYPVVFDATHSVQLPGGAGTSSAGNREYVEYLARAAVGAGVDALFMEVHDNPEEALCDGPNSVYLDKLEDLLKDTLAIYNIVRPKLS